MSILQDCSNLKSLTETFTPGDPCAVLTETFNRMFQRRPIRTNPATYQQTGRPLEPRFMLEAVWFPAEGQKSTLQEAFDSLDEISAWIDDGGLRDAKHPVLTVTDRVLGAVIEDKELCELLIRGCI